MKMSKRVLAVFLAVLLAFGSLTATAFASSDEPVAPDLGADVVVPEEQPGDLPETGEPAPEVTAEPAPEVTAEPVPETTAEPAPEATAEPAPEATEEPVPEATAEPSPEPTAEPEALAAVRALIAALPAAEDLSAMDGEALAAAYEQIRAAKDAYDALSPEEQACLPEAEGLFQALFASLGDLPMSAVTVAVVPYYEPITKTMKTVNDVTVLGEDTPWTDGWYVVRDPLTAVNVSVTGHMDLILVQGSPLTVTGGIFIENGASLTIWGQSSDSSQDGTLTVTKPEEGWQAGIGNKSLGNAAVTINGGIVTATGSYGAAGIGSGCISSDVTVTINGGIVKATGGYGAAGIGAGWSSNATVTINGGNVTATGGNEAAGIGAGNAGSGIGASNDKSFAAVTITGGRVTAEGGNGGSGIGAVNTGVASSSDVTINDGVVKATGSSRGAGIGGAGKVEIIGGVITAIGGSTGKDIAGDSVTITGGSVKAGSFSPQPVNKAGEALYLFPIPNPQSVTVTVQGRVWKGINHASADGDTTLYTYQPDTVLDVKVGNSMLQQYMYEAETQSFVECVRYYDPIEKKMKGIKGQGQSGTTSKWTRGWFVVRGQVSFNEIPVGEANVILTNGSELTVRGGFGVLSSLTIWGQNEDYTKDGRIVITGSYDYNPSAVVNNTVTINGGVIEATGRSGYAGLGGGRNVNSTVIINAGYVKAQGGSGAAGIGTGGSNGATANVTINGGVVVASGGEGAAGIGSSYDGSSAAVTINGGTVTANGSGGADIGGNGTVTITNGSVKGSASPQATDGQGNPAYPLEVYCKGGTVVIGGKTWQPSSHAALGDMNLYAYVSRALADENGMILVSADGQQQTYAIRDGGIEKLVDYDWENAVWTWDGVQSATVTVQSLVSGADPLVKTVVPQLVETTPSTCDKEGSQTYSAKASVFWEATHVQYLSDTKTVPVPVLGHDWNSAMVVWMPDHSQATVMFTCGRDPSHRESVNIRPTSFVAVEPTCTDMGIRTYTADATAKAQELNCSVNVVYTAVDAIPALGHDWDVEGDTVPLEPGVEGDNITLTIACRNDPSHTRKVYTTAEKISETAATCAAEGSKTYRMSFEFDGQTHVLDRSETYTLPKLPHTWGEWYTSGGAYERECSVCHQKEQSSHQHTYIFPRNAEWKVVDDQVVSAAVTVSCSGCDWSETLTYSGEQITSRPVTGATCTTAGRILWTVKVSLDGQTRSYTKLTAAPAKGHTWKADEAKTAWSEDHSAAAFTFQCTSCGETVVCRDESSVLETRLASCEQSGEVLYGASAEYGAATASAGESVETAALGHEWDADGDELPLQTGVSGNFTTVTVFCKHDAGHSRTVYAELAQVKDVPATCTESGLAGYSMIYTLDGETYPFGQEEDYEIPALGHRYTAEHVCAVCGAAEPGTDGVSYEWALPAADDASRVTWTQTAAGAAPYVTVIAVRTGDDGSTLTQEVVVTDVTVKSRTAQCDKMGTTVYEATVTFGGKSAVYTTELTDAAPAGHQWGEPTASWSDDMSEVTFTVTCAKDPSHTKSETVTALAETVTASTCESAGQVRYSASAQIDGVSARADETRPVEPLGHAWGFSPDDPNPPKLERVNGVLTATLTCRNDPSHVWTTTALQEELVDQLTAATCTAEGEGLYHVMVEWDGRTYVLGDDVHSTPMTEHDWGEWKVVSQDGGTQVRERTCQVCGEVQRETVTATPAPTAAPAATARPGTVPATGDETDILLWTLMLLGCGGCLMAAVVLRRRRAGR